MELAELPGRGLGVQVGAHLYPLRWRAVTFGIGGELAASRARKTPPQGAAEPASLDGAVHVDCAAALFQLRHRSRVELSERRASGSPRGRSCRKDRRTDPADSEKLKTINYGGGARWFIKSHLAFSFDVRFYAINPGPAFDRGRTEPCAPAARGPRCW